MSSPLVANSIAQLRQSVREARAQGKTIGLVPTMGALHDGHLSLVHRAWRDCDYVIATIFVNPTQFGPHEDFQRYPRDLQTDVDALGDKCQLVFAPAVEEMYPPTASTSIEPPEVSARWEGACRPGHFRGVATIVLKLLLQSLPDTAFFGEKDYQQGLVIQWMVRDLDVPVAIELCPTVREADGLAMSSRNHYLSPEERQRALAISRGLLEAAELVARGEQQAQVIQTHVIDILQRAGVDKIDYVAVVDRETLEPLDELSHPARMLIAAHVGSTRLIDNLQLTPPAC